MSSVIINEFIKKISNIFITLFNQELVPEEPYILPHSDEHGWDMSGIIGITGSTNGVISIRFTNSMVAQLFELSKIGSSDISKNWQILNDMTGEITNIIGGNVLTEIGGDHFDLSIPMTISGEDHIISWPKNRDIIAIPFTLPMGVFEFQISLEINNIPVTL